MGTDQIVANWTLVYTAELISFSLVLLFLLKSELRQPILIWISANLLAVASMLVPSVLVETSSAEPVSITGVLMGGVSNALPYFAINCRQGTSPRRMLIFSVLFITLLIGILLPYGWLSALIVYTSGGAMISVCAWAVYRNPIWKGLWGQYPLAVSFIVCALLIAGRGIVVYVHRSGNGFLVDADVTATGMRMLVLCSFMLQISFISVVIGHDLRQRRIRDRQAARRFEISRAIAEEQRVMEAVANERLDMISLLTHEVRQPINNAQAALEALDHEMKRNDSAAAATRGTIARAQNVLDDITLSISNAIIGVSLIEDDHSIKTSPMDATEIAELARSDCPADQRHRIHINRGAIAVFADLDPVLVRLALRNLFDNALKYAIPTSLIELNIVHDEHRLGVSFKVTNQITDAVRLSDDIFRRRVRGESWKVEGSGHGLFLVKKVAQAHHGDVSFTVSPGKAVTFDFFIPD